MRWPAGRTTRSAMTRLTTQPEHRLPARLPAFSLLAEASGPEADHHVPPCRGALRRATSARSRQPGPGDQRVRGDVPVEIRHRRCGEEDDSDDRTLMDAIVDAVDELAAGRASATRWFSARGAPRSASRRALRKAPPRRVPSPAAVPPVDRGSGSRFSYRGARAGSLRRQITSPRPRSPCPDPLRLLSGLALVKRYIDRNRSAAAGRADFPGERRPSVGTLRAWGGVRRTHRIRLYEERTRRAGVSCCGFFLFAPFTDPAILLSSLAGGHSGR